jgi:prephenate dehydrogenase
MSDLPFRNLTVIGLGLIGGSLAMAVRERFPDWHIQGVDPNAETLQYALKHGVIDKASLTLPERFDEQHLIVIATHLGLSWDILRALAPSVSGKDILVTDIGSCKREIVSLGQHLLPTEFIGMHPMAGKEFSGIAYATPLLFAGKALLLCPHSDTDPQRLEQAKQFAQALGASVRLIDADRHDRYMAYVSHLPQLYAILLTNLLYRHEPGHLLAYHGGGLDDQLRLAASPYAMWRDIFARNGDNMQAVLRELRDMIDEVLPLLEKPVEEEPLQPWFNRANEVHRQFNAMRLHR